MLIKQKTALGEDRVLINFIDQYFKEIDIALNICRLILNKDKNIDACLTQFTSIENEIILKAYIIGYNHKSNLTIPDIIKTLKDTGLIIEIDKLTDTLASKVTITLYTDKLKKNKQNINDIETYLKLRDLYIHIQLYT